MNFKPLAVAFLMVALSSTKAIAQETILNESQNELKEFTHDYFLIGPDKYLCINYESPHKATSYRRRPMSEAVLYDKNLQVVYNNPISGLKKGNYVAGLHHQNQLHFFTADKKGNVAMYKFNVADGSATHQADLFKAQKHSPKFYKGYSKDSSFMYFVCNSYKSSYKVETRQGVILDKNMNIVSRFEVENSQPKRESMHFSLSNEGIFYIITVTGVPKPVGYRPHAYTITRIEKDQVKDNISITDMPEGAMNFFAWEPGNDALSFTTLLINEAGQEYGSVINARFDLEKNKLVIKHKDDFNKVSSLQESTDAELQDYAKKGLPLSSELKAIYYLEDRSSIMVLESRATKTSNSIDYRGNSSSHTTCYTGDVFVFKLNADKKIEWFQRISKGQQERSNFFYIGCISQIDRQNGVHIYFNDHHSNVEVEGKFKRVEPRFDKKLTKLADVYITNMGKATKKFIADNDNGTQFMLSPTIYTVAGNKVIYDYFDYRNSGNSRFRLATIEIK